jgi:hypothetical protein
MSASNGTKRAAVMSLLRKGLVTHDEAAVSALRRGNWFNCGRCAGVDIATTRATYLLKTWRSEFVEEQTIKSMVDRAKPNTEQMRPFLVRGLFQTGV